MTMLVRGLGMLVVVLVAFAEMQPDPKGHQGARGKQPQRHWLAEEGYGNDGADERRNREIGPRSGCPKVAQSEHEQDEADAVAQKTGKGAETDRGRRRHRAPRRTADGEAHRTGHQALDYCHLPWIG